MSAENWVPVSGWSEYYEVSNHGRARSLDRVTRGRNGSSRIARGRILKPRVNSKTGYVQYNLIAEGKQTYKYAHTMVLEAFVGPRPSGYDGCHWDGDKENNNLSNLRWDSRKGNMADKYRHGTSRPPKKLDITKARCIRVMSSSGLKTATIAGIFNVSESNVLLIVSDKIWKEDR